MSEKLCLKWNDFQENVNTAFGSLRSDNEFSDVTLACEDGQQIGAHKVILAATSPFFHNLFRKNKHPHPLIYMRGLKSEDLVAIVDFLYYGEANVYQENIDAFLAIAEELNLKGLTGNSQAEEAKEPSHVPSSTSGKQVFPNNKPKTEEGTMVETEEGVYETAVAVPNYEVSNVIITEIKELDEQVRSLMRKSENLLRNGSKAQE